MKFSGRAWRLPENVDTDVIAPGKLIQLGVKELAKATLKAVRPDLAPNFTAGDLIVAGRNFGCGSSREQAPRALKELGVACVVAPSFARIFYRNCLAIGLPLAICEAGTPEKIADLSAVTVDLVAATLTDGKNSYALKSTPAEILALVQKGGILPLIKDIARTQEPS